MIAEASLLRPNKLCATGQSFYKVMTQPHRVLASVIQSLRMWGTAWTSAPSLLLCHKCKAVPTNNSKLKTHWNKHFPEKPEHLVGHVSEELKELRLYATESHLRVQCIAQQKLHQEMSKMWMRKSLHRNRTYLQDSLAEQALFFKSLFGEKKK